MKYFDKNYSWKTYFNLNKRPVYSFRNREINKSESKLQKILGPGFEYTGSGRFKIGNKTPDFVNFDRKIIVELYGNYWHRNEPIRKTQERINLFKEAGYKTIIIWESDLKRPNTVYDKIREQLDD